MTIGRIIVLPILTLALLTTLGCANLVALLPPVDEPQPLPATPPAAAANEEAVDVAASAEPEPPAPASKAALEPETMADAIRHMERLKVADNFRTLGPLLPGEFHWQPDKSQQGPMLVIISLPHQIAYVYRDDTLIGRSTVSTGKPGYETPPGVYPILQKRVEHYSNLYDDAPMPYMERLTWDGVAMHGGDLPGYPASHGCVRLPLEFSRQLYQATKLGTTVVVTNLPAKQEQSEQKVIPVSAQSTDMEGGAEAPQASEPGTAI